MLISEAYREQNKQLHENPHYGVSGSRYAPIVRLLCDKERTYDVLDYGAGKCTLQSALGFEIQNYDPCIPGLDEKPRPADIVACIDVLEHIEPDCIDDVLDDLFRLTKKRAFFVIANRPAKKTLPDGRNAHLIQEGPEWWLPRLMSRWHLAQFSEVMNKDQVGGFMVVLRAP